MVNSYLETLGDYTRSDDPYLLLNTQALTLALHIVYTGTCLPTNTHNPDYQHCPK